MSAAGSNGKGDATLRGAAAQGGLGGGRRLEVDDESAAAGVGLCAIVWSKCNVGGGLVIQEGCR